MKKIIGVLSVLLMVSTVAAQDLNYDQTSETNPSFSDANFTKESGLFAGFDLSDLSFFDAPESAKPGQQIIFEFENTVDYERDSNDEGTAIDNENAKFIVEIYDCGNSCGENDRYVEGIRFQTVDILEGFEDGDVLKGSTRYTIPDTQDGPMKATSYIWVDEFNDDRLDNDGDGVVDEDGEALISDSPAQEFVVQGDTAEGSDETVGPDAGDDDQGLFSALGDISVVGLGMALIGVLLGAYYFLTRE